MTTNQMINAHVGKVLKYRHLLCNLLLPLEVLIYKLGCKYRKSSNKRPFFAGLSYTPRLFPLPLPPNSLQPH